MRKPILYPFLISLLFMLPTYNKYWAPYDEGNYLTTAQFVLNGMVPYRDFFLVMYPPGHAYTLAGLLKLFGMNLMVARFYNIIVLSIICAAVFSIVEKLSSRASAWPAFLVTLFTMASLGEPPIPRAVWPGVALSLLAIILLLDFVEKEKPVYLLTSGLLLGLTTIYRHDIGLLTFMAGLVGLLMKRAFKSSLVYAIFPAAFVTLFAVWLYRVNALTDAFRALFVLPASFSKWASSPFPQFCLDFTMIFHRGCLFIKQNKYYIPIIVCLVSGLLYLIQLFSQKRLDKRLISSAVLLSLGVLYLQQLIFRVDDNHLAAAFPPSAILFGLMLDKKTIKNILVIFMALLMLLFSYQNIERHIKDVYVKPFIKKSTEPAAFKRGTVYIPDDVRDTFVALVRYVEENTKDGERIYVGHLKHNVPQWGWFDLIYFLTDRLPAVKYYVMAPGFQARYDVQEEMALDLERNSAKLLLLRDYGDTDSLGPLDRYIRKSYRLDKIIDSYHIYVKR